MLVLNVNRKYYKIQNNKIDVPLLAAGALRLAEAVVVFAFAAVAARLFGGIV
jgi:hypothetical protein